MAWRLLLETSTLENSNFEVTEGKFDSGILLRKLQEKSPPNLTALSGKQDKPEKSCQIVCLLREVKEQIKYDYDGIDILLIGEVNVFFIFKKLDCYQ